MIRLVADSGGIMNGGLAQVGRVGVTCATRSVTSWRARSSSVPRLKMSRIDESCATDFERSSSRPSMPLSCSSIGTVISSSTSFGGVAERDRLDLDLRRSELREDVDLRVRDLRDARSTIIAAAGEQHQPPEPQAPRDDPTHQPVPPASQWLACDVELGAVHLGRTDGDDLGAGGRPV